MVRWMCGIKLKDRLPSKELKERLGIYDIALVLQQNRLRWYGHDDWVKKCMEHEVEGSRPRGRPKKTWKEVVREDCQSLHCPAYHFSWHPIKSFLHIHKTKIQLFTFNSKILLHLSCHKNCISGSLTFHESKLHVITTI